MSNVPRGWTTNERRLAEATRLPVLARLPDVLPDSLAERLTKVATPGGIEHRFDPPQAVNSGRRTPNLVQAASSQQPHMFEHGRPLGHRGIPPRESPVLPRSNPFSNPRPRLINSVAPAVRFLTMVALFTAVGIWVQMMGRHAPAPSRSIEPPKTTAQIPVAPADAEDHTVPGPTATGPIDHQPDSGARVGRADDDDFASRTNSAAGPLPVAPMVAPPHFLISSGSKVPRVRVADSTPVAAADSSGRDATVNASNGSAGASNDNAESETDESPAMASFPGFLLDIPTR